MPPKRKGKKRKKKGRKKDKGPEIDRKYCVETQTDLNRKLAILRRNYYIIDTKCLEIKQQLEELEDERRIVVIQLEKQMKKITEQIDELHIKILEIEELRKSDIVEFNEIIEELEEQYLKTFVALEADLRMLFYKFYSLERVNVDRNKVFDMVSDQENRIKIQRSQHNRELFAVEKRNVVEKNILKEEIEEHFRQIAHDYRYSTDIRQSAHSRLLWQKHKNLQRMLSIKIKMNMKLRPKYLLCEENYNEQKINVDASEDTLRFLQKIVNKRTLVFNNLAKLYNDHQMSYVKNVQFKKLYCDAKNNGYVIDKKFVDLKEKSFATKHFIENSKVENQQLKEKHEQNMEYILNMKKILNDFRKRTKIVQNNIIKVEEGAIVDQRFKTNIAANKYLLMKDLIELVSHEFECGFNRIKSTEDVTIEKYKPGDLQLINASLFERTENEEMSEEMEDHEEHMPDNEDDDEEIDEFEENMRIRQKQFENESQETFERFYIAPTENRKTQELLTHEMLPISIKSQFRKLLVEFNEDDNTVEKYNESKKQKFKYRLSIADDTIDTGKIIQKPNRLSDLQLQQVSIKLTPKKN